MRFLKAITATAGGAIALASHWAWAQGPSDPDRFGYGRHMMGWGEGWYGMVFGPVFMILILVVVIAAVVLLVRWLGVPWHGAPWHPAPPGRTPLDILKERFARGEIDKEEFEERRRILGE
ncbi:MAG TPA: SHOCT domain-containing protein [Alphaproteobacteria bacterium]|jgi:putative membrane protein|nr:SHOCT domain-containing protein [Alphaproteobacteria bacterium]